MSLLRQFAGQTVIYGIGNILSRIVYFFLVTFYLQYRVSDFEYGLYIIMYGYATLFLVLLSYRIDTAFFRFGSKDGSMMEAFTSAFIPILITTIVLVLVLINFSPQISSLVDLAEYPHYVRWFAIILGLDTLSLLPFGKLRLENKAATFMIFRVVNIIISIVFILYFLEVYQPANPDGGWIKNFFPGLSLKVDYLFVSNMISSFILFIALLFNLGKISIKVNWQLWRRMVLYAAPLIIVGVANSINQHFSGEFQKTFLSGEKVENIAQAGIYGFSLRLASILIMFNTAFNYAAEPFFFKNAANKNDKTIYAKVLTLYTICAILVIIGLVYYLDILELIIEPDYKGAMFLIPILLFAFLMLGIYYNVSIWYKLADKNIYGGLISSIGVMITLSISIMLLPQIGYAASAWASFACYGSMVLLAYFLGKKHYPIDYEIRKLLGLLTSAVVMVILAIGIDQLNLSLLISILIKTILFLIFGFFLFKQNKSLLMELIKPSE